MPIYEYECRVCGHKLEAVQKMSEQPLVDCPHCQKPGLQKLVSAAGFQLKGTGWYATDFKNKGKPASSHASDKQDKTDSNTEAGSNSNSSSTDTAK
jgi:putative FmdB family regulatory protein